MPERVWNLADPLQDGVATELEAWPHPLRQVLYNRGLRTRQDVESFLNPESSCSHDPSTLMGMDLAVERIYRALRDEELIAIYGDFDVDGLTAVALLYDVLRSPALQGRVIWYLPHRAREGYGLNNEALESLASKGARLLITVDCGIGADDQVRHATSLGMEVIVTDHHLVSDGVPPALVVINPRQEGCSYPFKELAGVAVAYKLAEALYAKLWGLDGARERLKHVTDLVALGIIADVAPLVGENRFLVKVGLDRLAGEPRVGLKALLRTAGWLDRSIDAEAVSYILAPRLNAAGRMGDARLALELLLAESAFEAEQMALQLEEANRARQAATTSALTSARLQIGALPQLPPVLVLAGDYPSGIAGLVAGRLADEFGRPTFVVEYGETESRGSGRGVAGYDVVEALASCGDLLIRFGGHAQAGGFALLSRDLEALRERLEASALEHFGLAGPVRELLIDAELSLRMVGPALHRQLLWLEPHGAGNNRPVFCSKRLLVKDARTVGNGHLKLWLADNGCACPAIGFGMSGSYPFVTAGTLVDCAYTISRDQRNGNVGFELILKDLRRSSAAFNVL